MATQFRPKKRGVSYSQALAAAYASAPENEIILDTLEFRHTSFINDLGQPTSVRLVNDHSILEATLESSAPIDASQLVEFQPVGFTFSRPTESDSSSAPEISITVDNVSRILVPYLDMIKDSRNPVYVTWRPYLVSDLSTPHMVPPLTLTLRSVAANMTSVTAIASFDDLVNRRFPGVEYSTRNFPGLGLR